MTDSMRFAWRRIVVRDPHLSDGARRVLLELESYADPDGTNARPGRNKIAESLLTETGHVSEKTVRRALALGVELGYIECTTKGKRGRLRNSADVYRLTFPMNSETGVVDTQMSTSEGDRHVTTTGHPDVHQSDSTSGHLETTSGHFGSNGGHPDVHPPVPYTRTFTPEGGSVAVSNARGEQPPQKEVQFAEERTAPAPGFAALAEKPSGIDPDANPLAWIDDALRGGFLTGERAKAQRLLDSGVHYGSVRWRILEARKPPKQIDRLRKRREFIDDSPAQTGTHS